MKERTFSIKVPKVKKSKKPTLCIPVHLQGYTKLNIVGMTYACVVRNVLERLTLDLEMKRKHRANKKP